mgnify:CR=1 FL=1
MSKYLSLNLKWSFFTKNGRAQWKSLIYRIYINLFSIFLRIPILPLSFDWKFKTLDCYYKGDEIMIYVKKGKLRYISILSECNFNSLKKIDSFWENIPVQLEENKKIQ